MSSKSMAQNSQQRKRGPGKPFVKGGDPRINRGGIPAGARQFSERYRQALAAALSQPAMNAEKTRFEEGIEKLAVLFASGAPWAIAEVLDRLIGRPAQAIALTGEGGGPADIRVLIEHVGVAIEQARAQPQLEDGSNG